MSSHAFSPPHQARGCPETHPHALEVTRVDFKAETGHPLCMAKGHSISHGPAGSLIAAPCAEDERLQRGCSPPGDVPGSLKSFSHQSVVSTQLMQRGGEQRAGTRGHASKEEEFLGARSPSLASHPGLRGRTALPVSEGRGSAN